MLSRIREWRSRRSGGVVRIVAAVLLAAVLAGPSGLAQQKSLSASKGWTLQDYYALHAKHLLEALPPHSGLPPVLDLSKGKAVNHPEDRAWEFRASGMMGSTEVADPGVTGIAGPTTTSTVFVDGGAPAALQAKSCDIVIAKPVSAAARIAYNHKLFYSHYDLEILQVLKGRAKQGLYPGAHISGIQLGGMIRFPSGHERAFIFVHRGFLEIGKQYILFIWKVDRHVDSYGIVYPYLRENNTISPIRVNEASRMYLGMSMKDFEAKIEHAIAKNIDTN